MGMVIMVIMYHGSPISMLHGSSISMYHGTPISMMMNFILLVYGLGSCLEHMVRAVA